MATTTGSEYDHITISDGTDQTIHYLKDTAARDDISDLNNSLGEFIEIVASNDNSRNLYLEKSGTYTTGETIFVEPLKCYNGATQYTPQYIYVYGFAGGSSTKEYQWDAPSLPQKGVYITLTNNYDKIRIAVRFAENTTATAATILGRVNSVSVAGRMLIDERKIRDYSDLKINCIGDSLTYGYIPKLDDDHPATQMSPTWCEQLAADFGCTVRNYGIANNTLANNSGGTGDPMCIRYTAMDDDADIVLVMGGTNDFLRVPAALGTIDSADNTTIYGAYNVLVQGLIAKYFTRKSRIILMVPPMRSRSAEQNSEGTTLLQIQQAVRDIANKYALPYVDWANDSGINAYLISTDSGYTYTYDGIHIQQDIVLKWILPLIETKVKETILYRTL